MKIGWLSKEKVYKNNRSTGFWGFCPKICEAGKSLKCPRLKIIPYLSF